MPKPIEPLIIDLEGEQVKVTLKRHATARRLVLRLDRGGGGFTLTMPKRHSIAGARDFVEASQLWMINTLSRKPRQVAIADGAEIMLRGRSFVIRATGQRRGTVVADSASGILHVPGEPPHIKRRLIDWLKKEAEADLARASQHYADAMGCSFRRISVRDQKSRWGSCSSDGTLSYSWRLVLAPPLVLDYVAAHEVAHLKEMNHSTRFWRLVLAHCRTAGDAKRWIKTHGNSLHRYV